MIIIDLTQADQIVTHIHINYGFYALYLKCNKACNIKYGRKKYDYQEGTIVAFAPGQVGEIQTFGDEVKPQVYGVIFHPDFIKGTSLGQNIKNYGFFSYSVSEALHVSEREQKIVMECFSKIQQELSQNMDKHTRQLIAMNIELLLNYCMRFYERQFITREDENKDILQQFETHLNEYI